MKTIGAIIWGMIAGVFVAAGVIVFTTLIGAGAEILGFTKYTYWYYVTCLSVCIVLLVISKSARSQMKWMGFFFIAFVMVLGIGFNTFAPSPSGNMTAQLQENLQAIAVLLAKACMYIVPAALTTLYGFLAIEGANHERALKQGNT